MEYGPWTGEDAAFRSAVFAFLDREIKDGQGVVHWRRLQQFEFGGGRRALIGQSGIQHRPGHAAFAFSTTHSADPSQAPYPDRLGEDGIPRYSYRGLDPGHHDNESMKLAGATGAPLVWFFGIGGGLYQATYPVFVIDHDDEALEFRVAVSEDQRDILTASPQRELSPVESRYVERITRQRLHQPIFRRSVLQAYGNQCAVCRLRIVTLLEAAHIRADAASGDASVTNGLSLCRIHHGAFDAHVMGITPDYEVRVSTEILDQVDGPMLRHGLQEAHGQGLHLPRVTRQRPDRERLAERFEQFRSRGGA